MPISFCKGGNLIKLYVHLGLHISYEAVWEEDSWLGGCFENHFLCASSEMSPCCFLLNRFVLSPV